MGCAVHSMLRAGQTYTTVEMNVNFVRPLLERLAEAPGSRLLISALLLARRICFSCWLAFTTRSRTSRDGL
jgi:hypothetical protein